MKLTTSIIIAGLMLAFSSSGNTGDASIPYPENYRNWFHVKSMLIEPGHPLEHPFQGIHHVYANSKAAKGLESGVYTDGAVLVFDLLNYFEKGRTIQEGKRKLVGIMHKDARKYSQTGGWGFQGFAEDSKTKSLVKDGGASCFACHAPQKNSDYVFSQIRK
jgi:hypothetical protein